MISCNTYDYLPSVKPKCKDEEEEWCETETKSSCEKYPIVRKHCKSLCNGKNGI